MTNILIKNWLITGFILFCTTIQTISAQNKIEVSSFQRIENDITARVTAPMRDQNGEVCALIRVVTTIQDLMFEPDALGITARENKPGEIWLYVPRGARRISIMHTQLGILRNYFYPDIIEKATVYEMVINTGDEVSKVPAVTNTQLLVIRPEPSTADIYIDGDKVPTENGLFTATMKKGTHTYKAEAPMYASESGTIDLGAEQKIMSISLKPRFGYVEIFSLPEQDADVYVDGALVGRTPYKSDRMPLQSYKIRIEKATYFPIDSTVTIKAGETSGLTFKMTSTIRPKEPRRTLVMAEVGYHPSQISYGGMIGFVRKNGFYARFRSDFGSASTELECDDSGILTENGQQAYYKEGVTHKSRLSISAGYLRRIFHPLYLYVGAGYGKRTLAWETVDGELAKNIDHSASGIAAEIGAIGQYKKIALSVGFHTVNFKYNEISIGLGIMF
ncbi:PEGA domain-containing protein [Oscillospiraceae bacterium N12]|jgi:hypothetical protein|uniref:PEGA domain-containing protein n=1 Tax=Jilunia laotingensis TaxID=2763675 RepID=A0A926IRD4_9BACT|nr:PEGA domain-containing protein [Jilunia laotingensis]MBC8594751.1 PEGA domain-containing protein [Jilunia laotingensis]